MASNASCLVSTFFCRILVCQGKLESPIYRELVVTGIASFSSQTFLPCYHLFVGFWFAKDIY